MSPNNLQVDVLARLGRAVARNESQRGRLVAAIVLALGAQLLSFTLYAPNFWQLPIRFFRTYIPLCENPFTRTVGEPAVRHRILAPLIAYALGLRGASGIAIPLLAITMILILLFLLMRRYLSSTLATGSVILLATTLVVSTSQNWLGFADSLAQLFVLVCLMVSSIVLLPIPLFLGLLSDEKCVGAIPLIVFWHFLRDSPEHRRRNAMLRLMVLCLIVIAWLFLYLEMKVIFDVRFKADEIAGLNWLLKQRAVIPGAAFYALRGAWILPIMLMAAWWKERPAWIGCFLLAILIALVPGMLVADMSRSMAYAFPAVLIALIELQRDSNFYSYQYLKIATLFNLWTPQYHVFSDGMMLCSPLPIALVAWYFHSWSFWR